MQRISIRHSPNGEGRNGCKDDSCPGCKFSLLSLILWSLKTTCHGDWFQLFRSGSGWRCNSSNVIKSGRCWTVDVDGITFWCEPLQPFIDWWGVEGYFWFSICIALGWPRHATAWNDRWIPPWISRPTGGTLSLPNLLDSDSHACSKQ